MSNTCRHSDSHQHSILCIIPPHMLELVAMRGNNNQVKMAKKLLKTHQAAREQRQSKMGSTMIEQQNLTTNAVANQDHFAYVTPEHHQPPKAKKIHREIYIGNNKAALPGLPFRSEGDEATGDEDVDRAYDGAGDVFDLYQNEYHRCSIDGKGLPLVSTVHHRRNFNNAFWNGEQMVYGDGDGKLFKTFTELSIIGHEMTHGVVQFSGGLVYQGQSGALNESIADVFGALTLQRKQQQCACEADWLIGRGVLASSIHGQALRSLKAPGTAYNDAVLGQDPQPYHMDLFVQTQSDNGGVHINSGIPNHAFYLFAQYLGGNAWEKPGQIWYQSLQTLNNPHATFSQWAEKTLDTAIQLHGSGSWEYGMLKRAWRLVGIHA